jgi:hypothetical protein
MVVGNAQVGRFRLFCADVSCQVFSPVMHDPEDLLQGSSQFREGILHLGRNLGIDFPVYHTIPFELPLLTPP